MEVTINKTRITLATLIAPIVAPIFYVLGVTTIKGPALESITDFFIAVGVVSSFALPIGYMTLIFLGLPIIYFLYKLHKLSFGNVLICGLILGSLGFAFSALALGGLLTSDYIFSNTTLIYLLVGALLGMAVSAVFCFISGITHIWPPLVKGKK